MRPLRGTLWAACCAPLLGVGAVRAQQPSGVDGAAWAARSGPSALDSEPVRRLAFAAFLGEVGRENLDYAAQAFSVSIAAAQVSLARLFPNPGLAVGTDFDVAGEHQATANDVALTWTLLLAGKRGAHIAAARGQLAAARAQLDDFLRTLRGQAGDAYADAVHAEQVYARKRRTAEDLDRLVSINERRVAVGDIGDIDLAQSRVDAAQFHAELLAAADDVRQARLVMTALLTPRRLDTLVGPLSPANVEPFAAVGPDAPLSPDQLSVTPPGPIAAPASPFSGSLDLDSLVRAALATRPDVVAAHRLQDAADAQVRIARGDRWPDLGLAAQETHFTAGTNPIDPTPLYNSVSLGLSLPIPFSSLNRGEVAAARFGAAQAAAQVRSTEWRVAIDVHAAWATFGAAQAQLAQYSSSVLGDAERVRRARLYSYEHGAASLLDFLTAEQTANGVYLAFYDAEQQYMHALIALGQATDTWTFVTPPNPGP